MLLKSIMPRGLYGRAALILIVPIVTIQLVVSVTFIQRHFEKVTRQLTLGAIAELRLIQREVNREVTLEGAEARLAELGRALQVKSAQFGAPAGPSADLREFYDLSGRVVIATLREGIGGLGPVDLVTGTEVNLRLPSRWGEMALQIDRNRFSASNPHQLLVLMIVASVLLTVIAFLFLSNQLRPIKLLAEAADAFGKGRVTPYRPRGAAEVRAAGTAFLDMRSRIERQIEQRTLMLSGVSHDLRTPLTRLRLGLSMLPEDEETRALLGDVADMERLVDEFLAFARGDATEESVETDPMAIAAKVADNAVRMGEMVTVQGSAGGLRVRLRPQAVTRALENLVGNALRHGSQAVVTVSVSDRTLRYVVEDDGPGIPASQRDEALAPFARLDEARDPNRGGGAGLGLSIASDIARSHGGTLRLGTSEALGGLRAELVIAR